MAEEKKSVFATLNAINCNDHTEQKNGLTYLSWAWAWQIVKSHYPDAQYTIYETPSGIPYWTDGRTAWVKTGVTINGLEHIEYLPVMDSRKNSIPLDKITSWDMNKTIQRSLTKAVARHGLGLYIYAGEDIPDEESTNTEKPARKPAPKPDAQPEYHPVSQAQYWGIVKAYAEGRRTKSGNDYRTEWARATNAGTAEILQFDNDVENYKAGQATN